ncbi:PrGVORF112 [Pieris rapae granulovirus Wuhan]|uniref:PrGVORF112 n=1 Tax=Pieris rapae granulovirus Wuhan TaxID=2848030 RepID=D2J4S9_9BBAC|nr:PrGVORF112 [Betabaculovirus arrapae]ACZ63598.1 PrGVORF112 [Betabaculovirus arrapae]
MCVLLLFLKEYDAAPIINPENYRQASLVINAISCMLQFIEIFLVITFTLYKIKQ